MNYIKQQLVKEQTHMLEDKRIDLIVKKSWLN